MSKIIKPLPMSQASEYPGSYVVLHCPRCGYGSNYFNGDRGAHDALVAEVTSHDARYVDGQVTYPTLNMPEHFTVAGTVGHTHPVRCGASGKPIAELASGE